MVSRGSPRSRLPQGSLIRPMLATPGQLPPAAEDDRWAYEMKWDGVRAVGYLERGGLRLVSRNDLDITPAYPEVLGLVDAVDEATLSAAAGPGRLVLDGELVAFDDRGRTSFERLQERMHVRDVAAARRLAGIVPVVYLIFDVLHAGETSTLDLPYTDRRGLLDQLAARRSAPSGRRQRTLRRGPPHLTRAVCGEPGSRTFATLLPCRPASTCTSGSKDTTAPEHCHDSSTATSTYRILATRGSPLPS